MDIVPDQGGQQSRSLVRLFGSFLRLGLTAFGGPAMIAYIRDLAVKEKRWLDQETFQDGVALCQTIPGATAMQMAAYVGLKAHGVRGALCSYVGFGLPAFLLMLALSYFYRSAHALPAFVSVFSGLQAVVVALVANAGYTFGMSSLGEWRSMLIALAAAVLFWFTVNPIFVLMLAASLGSLLTPRKPDERGLPAPNQAPHRVFPLLSLVLAAVAGFILLFFIRKDLFTLACLIAKIDLMAFGGGFASIPLMFHQVVEVFGWMKATTFLDGIALGQFTPGPIVITATFIGFMVKGLKGACVATLAVFLPSFLMLIGVAPCFDRLRTRPCVARATGGILASFVGLLGSVTLRFAQHVHWDWIHLALTGAAFAALRCKLDVLWVIVVGTAISAFAF